VVAFSHLRQFSSSQAKVVIDLVLEGHVRVELVLAELTVIVCHRVHHIALFAQSLNVIRHGLVISLVSLVQFPRIRHFTCVQGLGQGESILRKGISPVTQSISVSSTSA
jgi:hypothetical protein